MYILYIQIIVSEEWQNEPKPKFMFDCKKNVLSLGRNHKNSRRGGNVGCWDTMLISFVSEGDNIDFIGVWLKWFACFVNTEYCILLT